MQVLHAGLSTRSDPLAVSLSEAHSLYRSVLAEAFFKELVDASPLKSLVSVDSASIGPALGHPSVHDPRVMWAAQKAGLALACRNLRPFDEQVDIVNYDLVLTMDRFDHEEVKAAPSGKLLFHTITHCCIS